MLTTGVRTPLGIKVLGSDLAEIQRIGEEIERALKDVKGTSSIFAERATGGYFLDFDLKRDALARYGLTVDDAESVLSLALDGSFLYAGKLGGIVELWDLDTAQRLRVIKAQNHDIMSLQMGWGYLWTTSADGWASVSFSLATISTCDYH